MRENQENNNPQSRAGTSAVSVHPSVHCILSTQRGRDFVPFHPSTPFLFFCSLMLGRHLVGRDRPSRCDCFYVLREDKECPVFLKPFLNPIIIVGIKGHEQVVLTYTANRMKSSTFPTCMVQHISLFHCIMVPQI